MAQKIKHQLLGFIHVGGKYGPRLAKVIKLVLLPILQPLSVLFSLFVFGSLGYYVIGAYYDQDWNLLDCAYMTSITLTTVGYGDTLGASDFDVGQIYTMILALAGLGGTVYSVSIITAFLVEGRFKRVLMELKMNEVISSLRGHTIICGGGESGRHVAAEHFGKGRPFVLIDHNADVIEDMREDHPDLLYVVGCATEEETLQKAGIEHAANVVSCLDSDRDNLFLVVSARWLRKDVAIIARCERPQSTGKFIQAGANHVVNPALIGGLRIAALVLMPQYTNIIDNILHGSKDDQAISEIPITRRSWLEDLSISNANLAHMYLVAVLGHQGVGQEKMNYLPPDDTVLVAGSKLLVMGKKEDVKKLLNSI